MNKGIAQRIIEVRKDTGLTQKDFGKEIGLKPSAISQIESGRYKVSHRIIMMIALRFKIRQEWLETGQGEKNNREPDVRDAMDIFTQIIKLPDNERKELCEALQTVIKYLK